MRKRSVRDLLDTEFAGEWGAGSAGHGLRECRVLRATNLTSNGIDYPTAARRFVPEAKVRAKRLRRGDLILEAAGGGPSVPVGRVARFAPPDDEWAYLVSNFFRTLRPALSVDPRFVHHILHDLYQQPRIWHAQQQTTGIINLSVRDYLQLRVPVPPLEEQRRIAEILDTIDETIHATQRAVSKCNRVRAGLVAGLLSEGSEVAVSENRRPGRGRNGGARRDQRQVGVNNRMAARLLELAESIVDGPFGSNLKTEHYVPNAGVRVVRLANLSEGSYSNEDEAFIEEDHARFLNRHDVRSGDVLVASLGDDNHRPGRACLYPAEFAPGIVKADCFRIRPSGSVDPRFLMETLNSRSVTSQIGRLAQGATRDRINLRQLRWVVLQIPPLEEQRRIVETIDTVDQAALANQKQLSKLQELRSGLEADLLSGRVRTVAA